MPLMENTNHRKAIDYLAEAEALRLKAERIADDPASRDDALRHAGRILGKMRTRLRFAQIYLELASLDVQLDQLPAQPDEHHQLLQRERFGTTGRLS